MEDIWIHSVELRSYRAYTKAWNYFCTFLKVREFALPNAPVIIGVPLLLEYGVWRFQRTGVLGNTIRNDISGIHFYLQYHGYQLKLGKGYSDPLQKLYRGCNRMRARYEIDNKRYYRRALTDAILEKMLTYVDSSTIYGRSVRCMLLFAKATALRSQNYVYTKDGAEALTRIKNITFIPNIENPTSFIVVLPKTKTNNVDAPDRETRTIHCRCDKGISCVVHELAELLKDRMENKNEALFLMDNGFPFTYSALHEILKILCDAVGIDWHYYTSHALRIGEATDQNRRGVPLEQTMKFVCWKNRKSAMIYIRPDNEDFVKFEIVW